MSDDEKTTFEYSYHSLYSTFCLANIYLLSRNRTFWIASTMTTFLIFAFLIYLFTSYSITQITFNDIVTYGLIALLIEIVATLLCHALTFRRIHKETKNKIIQTCINSDGFSTTMDGILTHFEWRRIEKIVVTKRFILFYTRKNFAVYLPRIEIVEQDLPELLLFLKQQPILGKVQNQTATDS